MSARSGQSVTTRFNTRNPTTKVLVNADSLPTGILYLNGVANGATVTVTNVTTGKYKAAVTLPTLAVGDVLNLEITATVSSETDSEFVWSDVKDIVVDSAGLADANTVKVGPSGSGTAQTAGDIYGVLTNVTYGLSALKTLLDTINSNVTNMTNLSSLANLFGSMTAEIPDTGTTQFPYTLVVKDQEGKLVDLDSTPTVTAANAAGADRSPNLSSVTRVSLGRYTFNYGVASSAVAEGITLAAVGAISSEARLAVLGITIADYNSAALLATISASLALALADTDELQQAWVDGGRLDNILDARASDSSISTLSSDVLLLKKIGQADWQVNRNVTPWQVTVYEAGTLNVLFTKNLKCTDGSNLTSEDSVIGGGVAP